MSSILLNDKRVDLQLHATARGGTGYFTPKLFPAYWVILLAGRAANGQRLFK